MLRGINGGRIVEYPMIQCLQCGKELESKKEGGSAAVISGSIMGDEYTESYFLCERCDVYTVEVCYEPFLGEEEVSLQGPVSRAKGDAAVNLIKSCSEPWNKKCRCQAHLAYFDGALD
jgi:hypothetical protein